MGFVWHAHDQVLDREVAVKEVFVPDGSGDRSERALSATWQGSQPVFGVFFAAFRPG